MQGLVSSGRLVANERGYELTIAGRSWLEELGMEVPPSRGNRLAYPCLDWSERRYHLAGRLATSLLEHFTARHWFARVPQSRALKLTPQGRHALTTLLD